MNPKHIFLIGFAVGLLVMFMATREDITALKKQLTMLANRRRYLLDNVTELNFVKRHEEIENIRAEQDRLLDKMAQQ